MSFISKPAILCGDDNHTILSRLRSIERARSWLCSLSHSWRCIGDGQDHFNRACHSGLRRTSDERYRDGLPTQENPTRHGAVVQFK